MTTRVIFCEGPDDLGALREIATRHFGAEQFHTPRGAGVGLKRVASSRCGETQIEIKAAGSKGELAKECANYLRGLAPEPDVEQISLLFDPDRQPPDDFFGEIGETLAGSANDWTVTASSRGRWNAVRDGDNPIRIAAIAWSGDVPQVDGLEDSQSLERVMLSVAKRALSSDEFDFIERTLESISALPNRTANWKSAVHILAALIDPKAPAHAPAQRFLGQNKTFKPHVEARCGRTAHSLAFHCLTSCASCSRAPTPSHRPHQRHRPTETERAVRRRCSNATSPPTCWRTQQPDRALAV